jgi:hypothetical protein
MGIRRRVILTGYATLLLVVLGVTVAVVLITSGGRFGLPDRIAVIGDIIAGSALLLSLIAALLALQAYAAATGLPELAVQVWFGASSKNQPVFTAKAQDNGWLVVSEPSRQTVARISLCNRGVYSARNPALVITLDGMFLPDTGPLSEWVAINTEDMLGVTGLQWDGGGDYSVHGKSVRRLPSLELAGLCHAPDRGQPALRLEMLADGGYRRVVSIPVSFLTDAARREDRPPRHPAPGDWL